VGDALVAARDALPGLRNALDDEAGRRRPHVRVFYNETDEDSIDDRGRAATDRDEILIVQSVSGG
jgi:hypothetical protein